MRLSFATLLAAVLLVSEVSASAISRPNHAKLARRLERKKRCLQRHGSGEFQAPASSSQPPPPPEPSPEDSGNNGDNGDWNYDNGDWNNDNSDWNNDNNDWNNDNSDWNNNNNNSGGTIQAWSEACGDPHASPVPTQDNGPNGAAWWLACGVDGSGWVPPPITLDNLVYKSLSDAINTPGSPFGACAQHLGSFQYWGQQLNIPDILLASIALQESSCNAYVTGGNGEVGLMQITPEKCRGDCYEPGNNIMLGAQFLAGVIDQFNGNVAEAMGYYNGWYRGITLYDANNRPTCTQRSNMDYLLTIFNGYLQGVDPHSMHMGTFFNLNC